MISPRTSERIGIGGYVKIMQIEVLKRRVIFFIVSYYSIYQKLHFFKINELFKAVLKQAFFVKKRTCSRTTKYQLELSQMCYKAIEMLILHLIWSGQITYSNILN